MYDFIKQSWDLKPADAILFIRGKSNQKLFTSREFLENLNGNITYCKEASYKSLPCYVSLATYTAECYDCGKTFVITKDTVQDRCGNYLCEDCQDDYIICDDCGEFTREDCATIVNNGDKVCEYCLDNHYSYCEHCNEYVYNDDVVEVHTGRYSEYWCSDCADNDAFRCDDCGKWYSTNDHYSYNVEGDTICEDCINNGNYGYCEDCQEYYYDRHINYCEEDECYYCDDCYENHQQKTIHDYGYKPSPYFRGTGQEYFGMELEVSGDTDYADEFLGIVDDEENLLYLKHDGSVSGFEIVTQPMTREFIYEVFADKLKEGLQYLNGIGFRGHNQGGIHIHVSKSVISNEQLNKLVTLLYPKSENNYKMWLSITQRHDDEMKQWSSMKLSNKRRITKEIREYYNSDYKPSIDSGRYTAINVTDNTIEFRIFNSNTRIERVMKNYEVIFSLLDFTKENILPTMRNYLNYIVDNNEKYKYLYDFLIEKKLVFTKEQKQREQEVIKMFDSVFSNDIHTIKDIINELMSISTNPRIAEANIDLESEV